MPQEKTLSQEEPKIKYDLSDEEIVRFSVALALEKKASEPLIIDLRQLNVFTEYFAILTVTNEKQAQNIYDSICKILRELFNIKPSCKNASVGEQWTLLDFGFFFLHLFHEEARKTYNLEELWNKGRLIEIDEEKVRLEFFELIKKS